MFVFDVGLGLARRAFNAAGRGERRAAVWPTVLFVGSVVMTATFVERWPVKAPPNVGLSIRFVLIAEVLFALAACVMYVRALRSREISMGTDEAVLIVDRRVPSRDTRATRWVAVAMVAASAFVAIPLAGRVADTVRADLVAPQSGIRLDQLVAFSQCMTDQLQAIPVGSVVMADPETAYGLLAVAPVYVVSSKPGHTANVPENRIVERYQLVTSFFSRNVTASQKEELLARSGAEWVLLDRLKVSSDGIDQVSNLNLVANSTRLQLYKVGAPSDARVQCAGGLNRRPESAA
jgi:hypothetical protein